MATLTFFEILCHLDEPSKRHSTAAAAFNYRKDHVLKCRHLEMRDDPFAERSAV